MVLVNTEFRHLDLNILITIYIFGNYEDQKL